LGSTAEEIIAEAPCPVLTIRPPQHDFVEHRDGRTEIRLNRVLLSTNFRPSSAAATQVATQLTNQTGAELHAVYVIGDYFEQISVMFPEGGERPCHDFAITCRSAWPSCAAKRSEAITHISEGRPYEEIVRLAAERMPI